MTIVIGFDLGHASTALAQVPVDGVTAPTMVDPRGSERRLIVTAVREASDGIRVGRAAFGGPGRLYTEFKSSRLDDPATAVPVAHFVRKIVADLAADGMLAPGVATRWVFGAPSAWSGVVRERYAQLLRGCLPDSVIVEAVDVIPESRAAMLYARDDLTVPDHALAEGAALVVDLGSSTADYTLVQDGKVFRDFGNDGLGAWLIEDAIGRTVLADRRHAGVHELMDADARSRFRFDCREAKERYFRVPQESWRDRPADGVLVRHRLLPPHDANIIEFELFPSAAGRSTAGVAVPVGMLEVLSEPLPALRERTWPQALTDDLMDVLSQCPTRPDVVLLTGGASGMGFVKATAREVFGRDAVVVGAEPEFAIARGLAIAGRIDVRVRHFRQEIAALSVEQVVEDLLPDLADAVATAVSSGMTQRLVVPSFKDWRNGSIRTIDGMTAQVSDKVRAELANPQGPVYQAVGGWMGRLRVRVDSLTGPICTRAGVDPSRLRLQTVSTSSASGGTVAIPANVATAALEGLTLAVAAGVSAIVATILFGAGTALVFSTGPIGWVIAFFVGLVAGGIVVDQVSEWAKDKDLPQWIRKFRSEASMIKAVMEKAEAGESALSDQIRDQLLAEESRAKLLAEISTEVTTQLRLLADEAELQVR